MASSGVSKKHIDAVRHYQRNPLDWVHQMFPDVRFSRQQEAAWLGLGRLIGAKLKSAWGERLSVEDLVYVTKIGVSIMAGRGTGKDAWLAVTILFFMSNFVRPKVPCTAPSAHQLKDVLWSELAKWIRKSRKNEHGRPILDEWFEWQSEKVFWREHKGMEHFAVARSVNVKSSDEEQAETLSGFHEDFMLFAVDEASGVPDPTFRPIEGTLTGTVNLAILIFNPTRTRGYAIRSQYEDAARWVTIRWNGEESELVPASYIQDQARYGKDSNTYRINVLGLPPIVDSDTLIPPDWIQDAIERPLEPRDEDPVIKTADFGAGGDKSVICTRRGGRIYPFKRKQTPDSNVLTDWVVADILADKADAFGGDVIGIGWAVMGNIRKRALRRVSVRSIDSRSRAEDEKRFLNKRAAMYWRLREDFERGEISIPRDQDVIDQLNAIRYKTNDRGQIYIIKKEEIKKELGGDSPDEADALAYTKFFSPEAFQRTADDEAEDEPREDNVPQKRAFMAA